MVGKHPPLPVVGRALPISDTEEIFASVIQYIHLVITDYHGYTMYMMYTSTNSNNNQVTVFFFFFGIIVDQLGIKFILVTITKRWNHGYHGYSEKKEESIMLNREIEGNGYNEH